MLCCDAGICGLYGVPSPLQLTSCPLPIDHVTETGVAVAVALILPALADAL